jgi:hypothetical protein
MLCSYCLAGVGRTVFSFPSRPSAVGRRLMVRLGSFPMWGRRSSNRSRHPITLPSLGEGFNLTSEGTARVLAARPAMAWCWSPIRVR